MAGSKVGGNHFAKTCAAPPLTADAAARRRQLEDRLLLARRRLQGGQARACDNTGEGGGRVGTLWLWRAQRAHRVWRASAAGCGKRSEPAAPAGLRSTRAAGGDSSKRAVPAGLLTMRAAGGEPTVRARYARDPRARCVRPRPLCCATPHLTAARGSASRPTAQEFTSRHFLPTSP